MPRAEVYMNPPADKPRINIVLPGKADVLKHFTRHCAFVKVVVVLILTLPAMGFSAAAVIYAEHQAGLLRTANGLEQAPNSPPAICRPVSKVPAAS